MYAIKPIDNRQLVRVSQVCQPATIAIEPGTFNIYLFESPCPRAEKCLQIHSHTQGGYKNHFPASKGYHVFLREEFIFMLGCHHMAPFNRCETLGEHLIVSSEPELFAKLVKLVRKIPHASGPDNPGMKTRLASLVKLLLIQVARQHRKFQQVQTASHPHYEALTARFVKLMNAEIFHRRSADEYARRLSVSRGILDQALQTTTGYTTNRLIHRTIVYKAKQAAINSNAPMKETAYNLGFTDMAHFSKFFRQNVGMTFSTFKQTFQNV